MEDAKVLLGKSALILLFAACFSACWCGLQTCDSASDSEINPSNINWAENQLKHHRKPQSSGLTQSQQRDCKHRRDARRWKCVGHESIANGGKTLRWCCRTGEACKYKDDRRTAIKINENELQLRASSAVSVSLQVVAKIYQVWIYKSREEGLKRSCPMRHSRCVVMFQGVVTRRKVLIVGWLVGKNGTLSRGWISSMKRKWGRLLPHESRTSWSSFFT